jgi:hypothetical protein
VGENGQRLGFEPDPGTAPVIREAFELRASGGSWAQVQKLIADGTGELRPVKSITKMLENRAYLGELRSGEAVNPTAHEPLVDDALFRRVQATRVKGKRAPRVAPGFLTGVVRCAGCGNRMVQDFNISRQGKRVDTYRCNSIGTCPAPAAINKTRIDPWVSAAVFEHYWDAYEKGVTPEDRTAEYEDRVRAAQGALAEVEALRGSVTPAAWAKALSAAEETLDAAQAELAAYTPEAAAPDRRILQAWATEQGWEGRSASAEQLRELTLRAVERVTVSKAPAKGTRLPVEQRAVITWRAHEKP